MVVMVRKVFILLRGEEIFIYFKYVSLLKRILFFLGNLFGEDGLGVEIFGGKKERK